MPRLGDLDPSQRPRERLVSGGVAGLSEAELLAVLLRTGRAGHGAVDEAQALLAEVGGLSGLASLDPRELMRRPGVGPAKASAVLAAVELGRRLAAVPARGADLLDRPEAVGALLTSRLRGERQEVFGLVTLDARHRLVEVRPLTRGTRRQSPVDAAEVFRQALLDDASGLIVFHNHPSGDLEPSRDDLLLTRRLVAAGEVVGVPVHDHVVVAGGSWLSLRRSRPELFVPKPTAA